MLVPSSRLLFWFALIALPGSAIAAAHAEAFAIVGSMIAAFFLLAGTDAILALPRLDGLTLELPSPIRLSKDREGGFEILVHHAFPQPRRVRLGLPLPFSFRTDIDEAQLDLQPSAPRLRIQWRCRPTQRGQYPLRQAFWETASALGFWSLRRAADLRTEIRVYPNLQSDRRQLAGLFLRRGSQGLHQQRMIGKGREFEKLREYVPGDSFEDVHWKATAKRGHPITKIFQIERTQEIYVLIDSSRMSARPAFGHPNEPSSTDSVLEKFLASALVLGLAAEQQNDLFGLVTFSDRVDRFLRASHGKAHYSACRDAIYTLQPRQVNPDFEEVASLLATRLRRRSLLIFLTAIDDPVLAEDFVRAMDLLSRRHLVVAAMVKPPQAEPLFSQPNVRRVEDIYARLGGHLQWRKLRELESVLHRRGVRFQLLHHERLSAQLIDRYLDIKRRQLL